MGKIMLKKMKISGLIAMIVLLLCCASAAAVVTVPEIIVDILRYEPTPVEPGGYFETWISIDNKGTAARDIQIEFQPEYPFSLAPGETETVSLTGIPAVEAAVVKFRFFVDVNAPTGDQKITFIVRAAGRAAVKLEKYISIRAAAAALTIDRYKVTPEMIKPGETAFVDLTLANNGKVGVKNIDITLDLAEDSKFSTLTTGTKQRIDAIDSEKEANMRFDLIADTSTEIKVYQLPILLEFEDFRGNKYSDEATVSLVVGAMPELSAMVDSTEIIRMLMPGEVSLKIVNNGIVDLKYLNTQIIETPEYEVLSPSSESYIGNLDSDDFETVDFIIKPKVPEPVIKLIVKFRDPYNKEYSQEFNLPLRIVTPSELGQKSTPYVSIILGLAVIAGIIYFHIRMRRKRKMQKK